MTMTDRCAAFARTFPDNTAAHLWLVREQGRDVAYGRWVLGQNYRSKTAFYGAYPPDYLTRVTALFPDVAGVSGAVLHAFSGSMPAGPYARCDAVQDAEFDCRVEELPALAGGHTWKLVIADPPYSDRDAEEYQTPMINRATVLRALAEVTDPAGHLCWLDCVWPMHSKRQWLTVGRIAITRSTNHRIRDLTIFERTAA